MPSLILNDGRRLAYEACGSDTGYPVIYCHGFPASRLEARLFHEAARQAGVWLLAPDRPGYGGSGFQPGRRIGDWPADVQALADHLGLYEYAVLGVSGGAPYAVSCAAEPDRRLRRLGLVCGLGPMQTAQDIRGMRLPARLLIGLARDYPSLALWLNTRLVGPLLYRLPDLGMFILSRAAPPADREILADPQLRAVFRAAAREAFRQGGRGAAWDLYLYTRDWGFDPGRAAVPALLWHGEADATVPVEHGRLYADWLPDCRARFLPGEGHFSLPVHCMPEVLAALRG